MDEGTYNRWVAYIRNLFGMEDDFFAEMEAEAAKNGIPTINIRPEEAHVLQFLARAVGAKKAVEIGTLFGYSSIWLARALPPDGKLYTLEIVRERAELARKFFNRAGLDARIEVLEGEAMASLASLADKAPFDFVFIDADKPSYPAYLEWAIEHVRPGGMIVAHNAFRHGTVLDESNPAGEPIRRYNAMIASDPRLWGAIIPMGDGIAAAIVRPL